NTAKVSKGHHCAELQLATHNRRLHLLGSGRNTLHKARDQVGRSLCTAQRHIAPARTERLHLLASARSSSFGNWLIPHAAGLHAIRRLQSCALHPVVPREPRRRPENQDKRKAANSAKASEHLFVMD